MFVVYLDGNCVYCRATGRLVKRLDLFGRVTVTSFRTDRSYEQYGLREEDVAEAMHVVHRTDRGVRVVVGYDAILKLLVQLPLLWLFYPLAWLVKAVGLGKRAYRFLAENRIFISDGKSCKDGICEL